ncbi:MAG: ATP-binding protein [Deltaproteobacteria bacterium]|nr:ATP-binding protein [Deltaproteobacteria bacterium]
MDDRIKELIDRPTESLSIELKGWFDPDTPEGKAKIIHASIAMRNHGGGYVLIGFKNETGEPDFENAPEDIRNLYHIDKIQWLISKYSSESFEIKIHFPSLRGQDFPVLEIPTGVKTPVATKSVLKADNGKSLIRENSIYVRSLSSNNTPSTAQATWKDFNRLIEVCFENREADIGRFLRRHLMGISPEHLKEIALSVTEGFKPDETMEDKLRGFLQESEERFLYEIEKRRLSLPEHGVWEVVLIIDGDIPPHNLDKKFLNLLESSNPNYTGWPVWLDSRSFADETARPYIFENVWEALLVFLKDTLFDKIDFMRLSPKGKFYLRSAFEDDISLNPRRPESMTALDFGLPILRTAEAISVGLEFAKGMGCKPEKTQLFFGFKWSKLRGRILSSWAWPGRYISQYRTAYQDEVFLISIVPLETSESAIPQFVYNIVKSLFTIFDGFEISLKIVEEFVNNLLQRRNF